MGHKLIRKRITIYSHSIVKAFILVSPVYRSLPQFVEMTPIIKKSGESAGSNLSHGFFGSLAAFPWILLDYAMIGDASAHLLFPYMLQVVLLERGVVGAENFRIGLGQLASPELEVGELQGADAVGDLGEPVFPGVRRLVENGLFREDEVQSAVEGVRHHLLAIVVVDLHAVEGLEVLEVVRQKDDEVALEPRCEGPGIIDLASFVGEGLAPERSPTAKGLEAGQNLFPRVHLKPFVRTLAVHQRGCMERQVRQAFP